MFDVTKGQTKEAIKGVRATIPYMDFVIKSEFIFAEDILPERFRQNLKFTGHVLGDQHHHAITWAGILGEECGEVTEEALGIAFGFKDLAHLRYEAVQATAVGFALIQAIDRLDPSLTSKEVTQGNA